MPVEQDTVEGGQAELELRFSERRDDLERASEPTPSKHMLDGVLITFIILDDEDGDRLYGIQNCHQELEQSFVQTP